MFSVKLTILFCAFLFALALAAPTTDSPPSQAPFDSSTTSTASPSASQTSAITPVTDEASKSANSTSPMSANQDLIHSQMKMNNSSFTCYGRLIGYYADVDQECKVYHFCLLGDYNGEAVYQRISYLCLNDTVFDQQALDCVTSSKMSISCKESLSYFDISNSILRQSILESHLQGNDVLGQHNSTSST